MMIVTLPSLSFSMHSLRCFSSFSSLAIFSSASSKSFALVLRSDSSFLGTVARSLFALLNSYCWQAKQSKLQL